MAITMTAQEFTEKHNRRLKGALQDVERGVNATTVAPGTLAAAKATKMKNNIVAAIDSGRWGRRVAAVTLDDWKRQMLDKGISRIAGGIDAAGPKVEAFAAKLLAYEKSQQDAINKMPDLSLEDSISRATAWIRAMSKFSAG